MVSVTQVNIHYWAECSKNYVNASQQPKVNNYQGPSQ